MTREEAISKLNELIECTVDRGMIDDICYEVIEFLKAQEPRVLSLAEYKAIAEKPRKYRDPVWEEWRYIKGGWKIPQRAYCGYGTDWRCWTSRPTDAQREAIPWN